MISSENIRAKCLKYTVIRRVFSNNVFSKLLCHVYTCGRKSLLGASCFQKNGYPSRRLMINLKWTGLCRLLLFVTMSSKDMDMVISTSSSHTSSKWSFPSRMVEATDCYGIYLHSLRLITHAPGKSFTKEERTRFAAQNFSEPFSI